MSTEEDEAFEMIEQAEGWRKRQIANQADVDPYTTKVRNDAIEEVAKSIEKFKGAFGQSTTDSFACFVRGMKR
jgi:hypothetical protein